MSESVLEPIETHHIAYSREQMVELCRDQLESHQLTDFDQFVALLLASYHHEYHDDLESLKKCYRTDPEEFAGRLDEMVQAANFTEVTRQDLERALSEESIFRLRLAVDFDDFSEVVFYRRGASIRWGKVKTWFGLRTENIQFTNFGLVLVYVRFRKIRAGESSESMSFKPGSSLLKLFENVPEADLEMLFPNTQVRMRLKDKILIGVPAFFSGIAVLTTKIGGTIILLSGAIAFWIGVSGDPVVLAQNELVALGTAAVALGGYLWKQYSSFKNRKIRFMKTLTENLYFKTLANNEGVLADLTDRAEESDTKEVLLAYTYLLCNGSSSADELKSGVEKMFSDAGLVKPDFEIDDALRKLLTINVVVVDADNRNLYSALPLDGALTQLREQWRTLF